MSQIEKKQRMTEYWSCGLDEPGHQHPTEEMAEKCLVKRTKHSVHAENCAVIKARHNRIIELYLSGMNFSEIGREIGVGGGTVRGHISSAMDLVMEGIDDRLGKLPDGSYTDQLMDTQYITRSLTLKQVKSLVAKWESMEPHKPLMDWWRHRIESQNEWQYRDGKSLKDLTAEERRNIRPLMSRKDWLEQVWNKKKQHYRGFQL